MLFYLHTFICLVGTFTYIYIYIGLGGEERKKKKEGNSSYFKLKKKPTNHRALFLNPLSDKGFQLEDHIAVAL